METHRNPKKMDFQESRVVESRILEDILGIGLDNERENKVKIRERVKRILRENTNLDKELKNALKKIVETGNINVKDELGNTALHYAVWKGGISIVGELIKLKADVNSKGDYRRTPLHIASLFADVDIVATLIDAGAEVDAKDEAGDTPLHLAIMYGNWDIVKKLIREGADSLIKNNEGKTALELAAERGWGRF